MVRSTSRNIQQNYERHFLLLSQVTDWWDSKPSFIFLYSFLNSRVHTLISTFVTRLEDKGMCTNKECIRWSRTTFLNIQCDAGPANEWYISFNTYSSLSKPDIRPPKSALHLSSSYPLVCDGNCHVISLWLAFSNFIGSFQYRLLHK
jgi:hypothetical protein